MVSLLVECQKPMVIFTIICAKTNKPLETYETENSTRTSPQKFNLSQTQSPKRDNRSDLKYFQSTRGIEFKEIWQYNIRKSKQYTKGLRC